jgi:hypothetical protein
MLLSRHKNAGKNHDVKRASICFENVTQFKYLGTTLTYQNSIQEEIKVRLSSGNACYYSVQNILSSRLLSKNIKIILYKTIILPVVLCKCETCSLILSEEHKSRVFENRVLRRIFGRKGNDVTGVWRNLHNEGLHNSYSSPNIMRMIKSRRMRWEPRCLTNLWASTACYKDRFTFFL